MRRSAVALVAALLLAAPASAQSPVIATVEGSGEITRAQFDHWALLAARSRERRRVPPRGTPAFRSIRRQVMQLLIQNLWIEGEARARGIAVTAEEVDRNFRIQRRQSFPRRGDFRRFLRDSGFTVRDIKYRVRLEALSNRLRRQVERTAPAVTPEEVRAWYDSEIERFTEPERRHVWVLRTRTRAAASRARAAIARGASFPRAARLVDGKARFDRLAEDVIAGRLARAIFRAPRGRVGGPVRSLRRWHVFRVVRIVPERTQPFEEAREVIHEILTSERRQEALDAFIEEFQARWRAVTVCRVRYATGDCGRTIP